MYRIYKITDNTNGNVYFGSTKQQYLSSRLAQHKRDLKHFETRKQRCACYIIISNGDYKIEKVEDCYEHNYLIRERHYITNYDCVNKVIPGRTQNEYRENNKPKIRMKQREWYVSNRERLKQQQKWRRCWTLKGAVGENNLLNINIDLFK